MKKEQKVRYVVCIKNKGHEVSLELRKIYRALPDSFGDREGFIRVIDESGEDYLFPAEFFAPVVLRATTKKALAGTLLRLRSRRALSSPRK